MRLVAVIILAFFAHIAHTQSCETEGIVHYSYADIKNILNTESCGSCHANGQSKGNWSYDTYEQLLTKGDCNIQSKMILHGNASQSYFFTRISGKIDICGEVNESVHTISTEHLASIEKWINFGAPENCVPVYSDVKTIFDQANCNSCHTNGSNSWSYENYEKLISKGSDDNCADLLNVVKGDANASLLYDKINNDGFVVCGEAMTDNGQPLSMEEIKTIRDWINSGAPENQSALPVELLSFVAENRNGKVSLNWETASEIGTDNFTIQRSNNGSNFIDLGTIDVEGVGGFGAKYSFTDENPVLGQNYYRLKIMDLDESFDYSLIRLATVKNVEAIFSMYPNPISSFERLTVNWLPTSNQERTYLSIVDPAGEYIYRKIIFEGTNYIRLPSLHDGMYFVIVEDHFGGQLLERLVIIN